MDGADDGSRSGTVGWYKQTWIAGLLTLWCTALWLRWCLRVSVHLWNAAQPSFSTIDLSITTIGDVCAQRGDVGC